MAIIIKKNSESESVLAAVKEISGVDINSCLQCKKCTNGCPVTGLTEKTPSEIIRRLQLGGSDEIFESDLIWMCVSCETCFSRCPMKIDMALVMDALRILAVKKGASSQPGNIPLFNRVFLKSVEIFGRTYDIGLIAAHKMGTLRFFQDITKFPKMIRKGKIALLPSLGGNKKYIKRIFQRLKNKDDTQ